MSKTYTTLSREGYTYLIGLIRNLANVSEGIDDLHLLSNGTFSSVKIDTLLNTLRSDCNEYTDRLVANLSRLELKIANDESEISQPNIMYLYKASGETSYSQYVVIEGVKILLGTCDIDMGNYYTITQADAKFVLKTDFDSLKTEVERKVNKTDIIDNLTSTDTDKPLSANQGKVLKDEVDLKANDSDVVKKTDIVTTIDKSSTDDEIPTAKAIYNKSKNKMIELSRGTDILAYADSIAGELVTITVKIINGVNCPYGANVNSSDFYYTIYNMPSVDYKRIVAYDIRKNDMYMIIKHTAWGNWQRVCTTSVADTSGTATISDGASGVVSYKVINGVCYVAVQGLAVSLNGNQVCNVTGLPKPSLYVNEPIEYLGERVGTIYCDYGNITFMVHKTSTEAGYGSFSYPVEES